MIKMVIMTDKSTLPISVWLEWLSSEETSSKSYISFSYFDRSSAGALTKGGDVPLLPRSMAEATPSLPGPSNSGDELLLLSLVHWLTRTESADFTQPENANSWMSLLSCYNHMSFKISCKQNSYFIINTVPNFIVSPRILIYWIWYIPTNALFYTITY